MDSIAPPALAAGEAIPPGRQVPSEPFSQRTPADDAGRDRTGPDPTSPDARCDARSVARHFGVATVAGVLGHLAPLEVDDRWATERVQALNALIMLLDETLVAAGLRPIAHPDPHDTVALHLRALGVLAARTAGHELPIAPEEAAIAERFLVAVRS